MQTRPTRSRTAAPPADAPPPDLVRALGHMALGTRFKRIGERLQAQTQALLQAAGIEVPASHCPVLVALQSLGPSRVGTLAQALGVAQPGVTRMLVRLAADGWVQVEGAADDGRARAVSLTPAGADLVARAQRDAFLRVQAAVAQACGAGGGSLLDQLSALEAALDDRPLLQRAPPRPPRRPR
ncbi:MAG: MarR family transcriptional regulator [Rubrivivax sp.]